MVRALKFTATIFAALLLAFTGRADTLIGNLPAVNDDAQTVLLSDQLKAVSFTIGENAFFVQSVVLRLSNNDTTLRPQVVAYLALDDAGHPAAETFASLATPGSSSPDVADFIFTTSGFTLAANTTYWLVVAPAEDLSVIAWKGSSPLISPTGLASFGAYRYSSNSGGVWNTSEIGNSFAILGTSVVVPETSAYAVGIALILGALVFRRRVYAE